MIKGLWEQSGQIKGLGCAIPECPEPAQLYTAEDGGEAFRVIGTPLWRTPVIFGNGSQGWRVFCSIGHQLLYLQRLGEIP